LSNRSVIARLGACQKIKLVAIVTNYRARRKRKPRRNRRDCITMPKPLRTTPRRTGLELNVFLPFQLSVLSNTISRRIAARYDREFGLSVWQWRVMAVAAEMPGMDATEIGRRTAMDKVAVSRAITGLIAGGLMQKAVSRRDRRRAELSLTRAGKAVYGRIAALALAEEARLIGALSAPEQAELSRLLDVLARAATGGDPLW
jgi:DNA-binding MarR family transcriptional regulator